MINWESILPKKNKNGLQPFAGNRNALIDVCIENLKQAEARGEICKPLSVTQISVALKKEYPICPRCHKQSVAGAHMTSYDEQERLKEFLTHEWLQTVGPDGNGV